MDTPVKRYSSGMYLRLGFAIAAHMEAEILLVDEVLAVGDVEFQRRCLGKMNEVEQSGRTVLFVSHNMDAMVRLCPTAMWLDKGRVRSTGPTDEVIAEYMQASAAGASTPACRLDDRSDGVGAGRRRRARRRRRHAAVDARPRDPRRGCRSTSWPTRRSPGSTSASR